MTTGKKKNGNPVRKIAGVIDAASKDADLARKTSQDLGFRRDVQKDRRAALSSFKTVQQALRDRAAIEKRKAKRS